MSTQEVLSLIQTGTLLGALVFAVVQVRQAARLRRDQQAIELVHSTQSPESMHSVLLVMNLPAGITAEQLDSRGEATTRAAMAIALMCEPTVTWCFVEWFRRKLSRTCTAV